MSLTSYRAAPPRVKGRFAEAKRPFELFRQMKGPLPMRPFLVQRDRAEQQKPKDRAQDIVLASLPGDKTQGFAPALRITASL